MPESLQEAPKQNTTPAPLDPWRTFTLRQQVSRMSLGIIRLIILGLWIITGLILEILLFPILPWGKIKRSMIQGWHRGALQILRIKINKTGERSLEQAIVCANHISWLDIIVIGASQPACFISKLDVKNWPIIGRLATLAGTIYVDRTGKNIKLVQTRMRACLREKNTLVFFPEGTTSAGDYIRPFKATLFRAAVAEGIPVQPLHIAYGNDLFEQRRVAYIEDDNFIKHLWLQLIGDPIVAQLDILKPIQVPMAQGLSIAGGKDDTESRTLKNISRGIAKEAYHAIVQAHATTAATR